MLLTYENETENHPRSSTQRHLCFFSEYSIGPHFEPGTPEHGTPAERRNNGTRNTSGIAGTPQKLEPEDKHGIFHYGCTADKQMHHLKGQLNDSFGR